MSTLDIANTIPVAFWLLPAEDDARWLDARIRTLAAQQGGPVFDAHVTLHTGRWSPDTDIEALLARVAKRKQIIGLTLEAGRTRESAARFKALFVDLQTDRADGAALMQLRSLLVEELIGVTDPGAATAGADLAHGSVDRAMAEYEFLPHLSLLYGDFPQSLRAELAAGNGLEGRTLRFDRVAAVKPKPGFPDLGDSEHWHVFGHRRLGA